MRLVAVRPWLRSKMHKHYTISVSMKLLPQVVYQAHFACPALQTGKGLAVAVALLHTSHKAGLSRQACL